MGVLATIAKNLDTLIGPGVTLLFPLIPVWPYMKLLFCIWLVLPIFNGAAYIYENIVREYVKPSDYINFISSSTSKRPEGQNKFLQMMSLDARKSVERFIDQYGPEAFERVVRAVRSN
ncbi:hypothetical protein ACLB2K_058775 [Fragaria x ananassa]